MLQKAINLTIDAIDIARLKKVSSSTPEEKAGIDSIIKKALSPTGVIDGDALKGKWLGL